MNILAINPWIIDCAAYDFWLKPYGFLVILTYLKNKGLSIDYIDCLDKKISQADFGRGKYYCEIIPTPGAAKSIPRYFKRYGMPKDEFEKRLVGKNPDYILITSSMTYWYPAIIELNLILRKKFPKIPIILGGTYATLCDSHAKENNCGDFIFKNSEIDKFFKLINCPFNLEELYSTLPDYENFYSSLDYLVLRTSWGCPFSCSFCAIKKLSSGFLRINSDKIVNFIVKYARRGLSHFVLYDDAFLYEPEYAKILLNNIVKRKLKINFHTPNALHLRFLDPEISKLLKQSGFINPHFGLETLNPKLQKAWGDKATRDDLVKGIESLKNGGFKNGEFSIYLLLGYPNQDLDELKSDVEFINRLGARVSLAEFSPVPETEIFKHYQNNVDEPILHNNSLFSFFQKEKIKDFWKIKNYVRDLNKKLN
ncbi:MAG: radical SAM protein [Candidatus Omnitrophica bacterium]|nr:radical SAM protein [Candidatus Omnitrophota bacterium]